MQCCWPHGSTWRVPTESGRIRRPRMVLCVIRANCSFHLLIATKIYLHLRKEGYVYEPACSVIFALLWRSQPRRFSSNQFKYEINTSKTCGWCLVRTLGCDCRQPSWHCSVAGLWTRCMWYRLLPLNRNCARACWRKLLRKIRCSESQGTESTFPLGTSRFWVAGFLMFLLSC